MLLLLMGCAGPEVPEGVVLSEVQSCPEPLPGVSYAEVGAASGLQGNPEDGFPHHHGGGAAVDDFDLDGDLDLILSYPVGPPLLYTWQDGAFSSETLPGPEYSFLLNLADVDGDGDSDLLAGGYKIDPVVVRNDGDAWTVLPLTGLPESGARVRELSPGDLDGDGIVDLYALVNTGSDDPAQRADFLLRGVGDGTFTLIEDALSQELAAGRGFDAVWVDIDGDLDQDLYVVNDDGADFGGNVLYDNDGGVLTDVSAAHSVDLVHFGMGVDAADFSGDGVPDFYLTGVSSNVLFQSLSDGSYADVSQALGADPLAEWFEMGWGAIFLDVDNDGDLDVLNAQGDRWAEGAGSIVYEAPIDLLIQDGDAFTEQGGDFGLSRVGSHRSLVAADFNGDGVLDLLVTDVVAAPRLYLSEGCTAAGWVSVRAPVGSEVVVEADGRILTGWVSQESSYGAGKPAVAHFGLGAAQQVDALTVTLPDGTVSEVRSVEARRVITVE